MIQSVSTLFQTLEETLPVYDGEGYGSMTFDLGRNDAYKTGLRAAMRALDAPLVLEIGPGADAVLSGFALAAHARARVVAVEGNPRSAQAARASPTAQKFGARLLVLDGLSTRVDRVSSMPADVVLHEVLGYFASREGAVVVARDLLARMPAGTAPRWAPSAFGTFFVHAHTPPARVERLAADQGGMGFLRSRTPLDPRRGGCLEWFEMSPATREVDVQAQQRQRHASTCTAPGDYNSLVFYIWAGFSSYASAATHASAAGARAPTTRSAAPATIPAPIGAPSGAEFLSAFSSAPLAASQGRGKEQQARVHRAQNWPNVVLFYDHPVTLCAHDALEVDASVDASAFPPRYHVTVTHVTPRDGRRTVVLDRDFY